MIIVRETCNRGFTLIELLVVVAVIGLLSSIALASLSSAREKAAVASTITNFKQVEKALLLLADEEGISTWWQETSFCPSNCDISFMIEDTNRLGKFLPLAPTPPIGTNLHYDNDLDSFACGSGGPVYQGVNLGIRNVSMEFAQKVSVEIDGDNDLLCGRIRWDPSGDGSLFYNIANSYQNY